MLTESKGGESATIWDRAATDVHLLPHRGLLPAGVFIHTAAAVKGGCRCDDTLNFGNTTK